MKALVTGGAGFIGSHLCEKLLAEGWEVTALDNLSTGKLENLAGCKGNPLLRFVEAHLPHVPDLSLEVESVDVVFHLAAFLGPERVMAHPVEALEENVQMASEVFFQAGRLGKRLVFTSTSELAGANPRVHSCEPRNAYAIAKLWCEAKAFAYKWQRKAEVSVVRLFNIAGPRQTEDFVIPRFVGQALRGEPLTVIGRPGCAWRTFCHVDDAAEGLWRLGTPLRTDTFWPLDLGSPELVTITSLAELVKLRTGSTSEIVHVDSEKVQRFDAWGCVPDMERIKNRAEWEPRKTLADIIDDVIAEKRGQLAAAASS